MLGVRRHSGASMSFDKMCLRRAPVGRAPGGCRLRAFALAAAFALPLAAPVNASILITIAPGYGRAPSSSYGQSTYGQSYYCQSGYAQPSYARPYQGQSYYGQSYYARPGNAAPSYAPAYPPQPQPAYGAPGYWQR
jgi:hypothetical protein